MKPFFLITLICSILFGCSTSKVIEPTTLGDAINAPNYGYTPVDPLPAYIDSSYYDTGSHKDLKHTRLLNISGSSNLAKLLSNETIRIAIGTYDRSLNLSFASSAVGVAGSSYKIIMDYIKYVPIPISANIADSGNTKTIANIQLSSSNINTSSTTTTVIPLYVGVGLRITADITVKSGTINLGNIFGIGASASTNQTSGTLTVQTLGITGDGVSSLIPMPGELNSTTIQNAIISLGAIKAKIYEPQTSLAPCVIGYYNNIGGNGTVITNKLISNVLSKIITVPNIIPIN